MRYFLDTEFLDDGRTIELISIGIVRDDGPEYYAVLADADWERIHANEWLATNVVPQLPPEACWKPRLQVAEEVRSFLTSAAPELWAWFGAYDFVALAQLYGRMLDLPAGIPHFINDFRSYIDTVQVKKLPAQVEGRHDALEDARHLKVRYDFVQMILAERHHKRAN